MAKIRNILFIMCDQLRFDYLSCMGHPHLQTPNIDALAQRGVLFSHAVVQSPVCGPSRMSFYTGRYMSSHGATWNRVPLSVRERTIGDYLRPHNIRTALVGKTHMMADAEGLRRYNIDPTSEMAELLREGGFEPFDRYEGHADPGPESAYVRYLKAHGYDGDNVWGDNVISAEGPGGEILDGWAMRNAKYPARVREEHSETAYSTDNAIRFIQEQGESPWCLHLSYIKPHWPYLAPRPYHNMYGPDACMPANRSADERANPHPVYGAYLEHQESKLFAKDETVATVKPVYMGLVKQIDDHLGRLFEFLGDEGRFHDTLIFFTSDHGDFLGDHWLGEKELFYEEAIRIPFILYDPDGRADATRGTVDNRLIEAVDVVPTILDGLGLEPENHLIEGRSLLPLTRQSLDHPWREFAISELDYSFRDARVSLGQGKRDCRGFMLRTEQWKYIHWIGFRPQLFDLATDPSEHRDLGEEPAFAETRHRLSAQLLAWMAERKLRVTVNDSQVQVNRLTFEKDVGIRIGEW